MKLLIPAMFALAVFLQSGCEETGYLVLEVQPHKGNCTGVGNRLCFQVQRGESNSIGNFYSGIAGFDYQWGYRYLILVHWTEIESPAADQPGRRYELEELVTCSPVEPGYQFTLALFEGFVETYDPVTGLGKLGYGGPSFLVAAGPLRDTLRRRWTEGYGLGTLTFEFQESPQEPLQVVETLGAASP